MRSAYTTQLPTRVGQYSLWQGLSKSALSPLFDHLQVERDLSPALPASFGASLMQTSHTSAVLVPMGARLFLRRIPADLLLLASLKNPK
jgi:hypothetical protein